MEFPLSYTEPRDELLAVRDGLTEAQLKGWRAAGILPLPIRKGLGRGRGVVSLYPGGSTEQVRRILRWKAWDRRLDVIRWCLWLDPFTPYPPSRRVVAAAAEQMIERGIGLDVWEDVEAAGRGRAAESVRRAVRAYLARRLGLAANSDIVRRAAQKLTTLNSDESFPDRTADRRLFRALKEVLEPLIPGVSTFLLDDPDSGRKALVLYRELLATRKEMLHPGFLPGWIRDTHFLTVDNVLWDARVAHEALEGRDAWEQGPPTPALLYLAIFVRSLPVTFDGIRDALWSPTKREGFDAIHDFLHAIPIKKAPS